jgi:hypothetical protein
MGKKLTEKLEDNKELQISKPKRENYCYYSSYSDNGDYERRYINGDFEKREGRIYEEQKNGKYTSSKRASNAERDKMFPLSNFDLTGSKLRRRRLLSLTIAELKSLAEKENIRLELWMKKKEIIDKLIFLNETTIKDYKKEKQLIKKLEENKTPKND